MRLLPFWKLAAPRANHDSTAEASEKGVSIHPLRRLHVYLASGFRALKYILLGFEQSVRLFMKRRKRVLLLWLNGPLHETVSSGEK